MRTLGSTLFCILFLISAFDLAAAQNAKTSQSLVVEAGKSHEEFGRLMEFSVGPRSLGELNEGQALYEQKKFTALEKDTPDFRVIDAGIWLRFSLDTKAPSATKWVLDTGRPFLRKINIWVSADGQTRSILKEDRNVRYQDRQRQQRILVSKSFPIEKGSNPVVWIYYESDSTSTLPVRIYPAEDVYKVAINSDVSLIIFYTIALIFLAFMGAFAFALSSRVSFYYFGFFGCVLAYNAQLTGTLFTYIWPSFPQWNAVASHPFGMGAIVFALLMGRAFNRSGRPRPWLNKFVIGLTIVAALYIFAPIVLPLVATKKLAGPIVLTFLATQVVLSIVALKDKVPGAKFYLLGSLTLFGYIGIFTLLTQGQLEVDSADKELIIRYGQLLDGLIFCLAVVRQTWVLRNDVLDSKLAAEMSANELATARHDLRQPLFSLKMALGSAKNQTNGEGTQEQIAESLDYLEALVAKQDQSPNGSSVMQEGWEPLPLAKVLKNLELMFTDEAREHGIDLRIIKTSLLVDASSVALLRVLANLISNAIHHSGGTRIVLGVRRQKSQVRIHCLDDGVGFAARQFDTMKGKSAKSNTSDGEGLGLNIVSQICNENSWEFGETTGVHNGAHLIISGIKLA